MSALTRLLGGALITEEGMKKQEFPNGMTVADLKEAIKDWPELDSNGEPCEVWVGTGEMTSNQAKTIIPLNARKSKDGKIWADIILEP